MTDVSALTRTEKEHLIDLAVDEVLRELHDERSLTITTNPASNLRDALVSKLNQRLFDIAFIEDIDDYR